MAPGLSMEAIVSWISTQRMCSCIASSVQACQTYMKGLVSLISVIPAPYIDHDKVAFAKLPFPATHLRDRGVHTGDTSRSIHADRADGAGANPIWPSSISLNMPKRMIPWWPSFTISEYRSHPNVTSSIPSVSSPARSPQGHDGGSSRPAP